MTPERLDEIRDGEHADWAYAVKDLLDYVDQLAAESASLRQGVETLREALAFVEYETKGAMDSLDASETTKNSHAQACCFRAWGAASGALDGRPSYVGKLFDPLKSQLLARAALRETEGLGAAGKAPPGDERDSGVDSGSQDAEASHKPNADATGSVKP